jgi:hypothetical protein
MDRARRLRSLLNRGSVWLATGLILGALVASPSLATSASSQTQTVSCSPNGFGSIKFGKLAGPGTHACNLALPDHSTIVGMRAGYYDAHPNGHADCVLAVAGYDPAIPRAPEPPFYSTLTPHLVTTDVFTGGAVVVATTDVSHPRVKNHRNGYFVVCRLWFHRNGSDPDGTSLYLEGVGVDVRLP